MIVLKRDGDKTVSCMHSGLWSGLNDCGVRSDWYAYVFVGSISLITSVEKDEKELQIIPEEVFHGKPATPLTVLTSQAWCLPKLATGDRWLFFLRNEESKPIVLDYYGNDSLPVAYAQEKIETLRRLENIGDFGILRGQVRAGEPFEGKAVPNARVIAQGETDKLQFMAYSDADGHYEFQPLPPGIYKITVDNAGSRPPDDTDIRISRGGCWDMTLSRSPHAEISGHVHFSDGTSAPNVAVIFIRANGSGYNTSHTDAHGDFTFGSLDPGEYVVGINLPGAPAWKYESCGGPCEVPPASLYFNGAVERSGALVIKLETDEKRQDIDFVIPKQ
ncbi:MAG TPA: carboxypeptidase-like regulatory domain-containing protein [Candidatus Acidoferrum sp.]|nr:carboxypeptidase-like regulatory domain-containing protein [Candidatus Acidoferrum sp.]